MSQPPTAPVPPDLPAGCPMDLALKFLAREWTAHIVWLLGRSGETRFLALQRALPGKVSARTLSGRLKQLQAMGLIARHDVGTVPPHVAYRLTEDGHAIDAMLRDIERRASDLRLPITRA